MYNFTKEEVEVLIDLLTKEIDTLEECGDESTKELKQNYISILSEVVK